MKRSKVKAVVAGAVLTALVSVMCFGVMFAQADEENYFSITRGGETTEYATWDDALAAADQGDTIKSTQSIVLDAPLIVPAGKTVYWNINDTYVHATSSCGNWLVECAGTLVIQDSNAGFSSVYSDLQSNPSFIGFKEIGEGQIYVRSGAFEFDPTAFVDASAEVVEDTAEGVWDVMPLVVASLGEDIYIKLDEAVNDAKAGDTIALLADTVIVDEDVSIDGITLVEENEEALLEAVSGTTLLEAFGVTLQAAYGGTVSIGKTAGETTFIGVSKLADGKTFPVKYPESKLVVYGGYFVADPTDFLAEGKQVVESDVEGYAYKVVDAPAPEDDPELPGTGDVAGAGVMGGMAIACVAAGCALVAGVLIARRRME